jgi:tetratricopeptide (TPR) repeat protein/energy-coupling factor transporter ATP-binding protein EcfA2
MTDNTSPGASNGHARPYTSLSSLKEAHTALLKGHDDDDCGLLDSIEEFVRRGSATGVYLDSYDERLAGQSLLDYWVTVLYRARRTPPDATLAEFDASLSPVLADSVCPYRGLTAFQEKDKDFFFGRQRLVETLVQKIRAQRFVFVVGSSGSGKSSLVLAGLVPVLKNGLIKGSESWQYLPRVVPGHNPLRNLARALAAHCQQPAAWAEQFAADLLTDAGALDKAVSGRGAETAVLVVDQFEEAYTLCTDDKAREAFINNLIAFAHAGGRENRVVLTLRTDYEDYLAQTPALFDLFADGQVRITPLTAAELRTAIEEPARRVGLKFEDGIVDSLVKEILGEPAGLPLLQFTLLRLWKMREGGRSRITWKEYKRLEGPRSALALTADEVYKQLVPQNKFAAKKILLRLARPSGNMEVTSNRVRRSDLYFVAKDRINEVLDKLGEAGLIHITKGEVEDDDQVEVAHEALVRNWPRLTDWLEKERKTMRQRLRLTAAAEQWNDKNRDKGGLIGGELLKDALGYDDLNELEKEFVQASKDAAERAEREKKETEEREKQLVSERLIAYQQKAAEEAKNSRRLRHFLVTLALLTVFALAAAVFGILGYVQARASAKQAVDSEKKAQEKAEEARVGWELAEQRLTAVTEAQREANREKENASREAGLAREAERKANERTQQYMAALRREKKAKEDAISAQNALNQYQAIIIRLAQLHQEADSKLVNRPEEAAQAYEKLRRLYPLISDNKRLESAMASLARVYKTLSEMARDSREFDKERDYLEKSREVANEAEELYAQELEQEGKAGRIADVIPVLEERAQFYLAVSESEKAASDYRRALDLQETLFAGGDQEPLKPYDNLVRSLDKIYHDTRDEDSRKSLYEESVGVKERYFSGQPLEMFRAYRDLGRIYEETRDKRTDAQYEKALHIAEGISQKEGDNGPLIGILRDQATFKARMQDYKAAEETYRRAISLLENDRLNPNSLSLADLKMNLGDTYRRQQAKTEDAASAYRSAIEIYDKHQDKKPPNLPNVLSALAGIYAEQKHDEKATPLLERLVDLSEKDERNPYTKLIYRKRLADNYAALGKNKEAEDTYKQAIESVPKLIRSSYQSSSARYGLLRGLGRLYMREGKLTLAEEQFRLALQAGADFYGPNSSFFIEARVDMADLLEAEDKHQEAADKYLEIINMLGKDERFFTSMLIATLEKYAGVLRKLGRETEAEEQLTRAKKLKEKQPERKTP